MAGTWLGKALVGLWDKAVAEGKELAQEEADKALAAVEADARAELGLPADPTSAAPGGTPGIPTGSGGAFGAAARRSDPFAAGARTLTAAQLAGSVSAPTITGDRALDAAAYEAAKTAASESTSAGASGLGALLAIGAALLLMGRR